MYLTVSDMVGVILYLYQKNLVLHCSAYLLWAVTLSHYINKYCRVESKKYYFE